MYELKAESSASMLKSVSFRTLLRGPAGAELRAAESEALPDGAPPLPGSAAPSVVWEFPHFPGSLQGDVRLEFRLPPEKAAGGAVMVFVRAEGGWESRVPAAVPEADGSVVFSVTVPPAPAYAVAPVLIDGI